MLRERERDQFPILRSQYTTLEIRIIFAAATFSSTLDETPIKCNDATEREREQRPV